MFCEFLLPKPIISTRFRSFFGAAIYDCGEYLVDAAKRLEICCFDYSGIVFRVPIRHSVEKLKSGNSVFFSVVHICFLERHDVERDGLI